MLHIAGYSEGPDWAISEICARERFVWELMTKEKSHEEQKLIKIPLIYPL